MRIGVKRDSNGRFIKGHGFWTGKKRPNLKNTNASKTMFPKGVVPWNKGKKKERICPNCKTVFYIKGNDFCSRQCALTVLKLFRKGFIPWNKGMKGFMAGEKNANWKGGISKIGQRLRTTIEYKEWRQAVFVRDNYTCVLCGKRGGKIQADHFPYPFALYPQHRLNLDNGRTLCVGCHKTETFGGKLFL